MTHDLFVFAPAVVALIVMAALLHEYRRPRARTPVEKRAMMLLRSWLTPEQERQCIEIIADNDTFLGIEHHQALGHVVECCLEPCVFFSQLTVGGVELICRAFNTFIAAGCGRGAFGHDGITVGSLWQLPRRHPRESH
jgi:hypothetical protein